MATLLPEMDEETLRSFSRMRYGHEMWIDGVERKDGEITALFCCSDRVAQSAIRELLARGIRIPLDLSVFGFDDNIYSPDNPIPLSTVRQNFEAIGHRAADLLLWRLTQEGPVPPLSLLTDTQVILRDSTRSIL